MIDAGIRTPRVGTLQNPLWEDLPPCYAQQTRRREIWARAGSASLKKMS